MVEIIAFPGKTQSTTVDTSRLNLEASGTRRDAQVMPVPQISSTLDGTVVVSHSETADNFPEGDWTNQELADLYRVESLLVQAGIKMSTGRGVTDENDPWFVFCREDGDVFVHLARADGRYLLDSPGLSGLLEGPDFATLIDTFVKQLAALRATEDESNVVSFRPKMLRDKSVHLHPSILLAALIWTLYLASDDIASATEAASDLAEDMILPVDKLLMMDQSDTGTGDIEATDIDGTAPDLAKVKTAVANPTTQAAVSFADADRSGSDRLVSSFGAMIATASPAAQAVSASLAVIAFSFGFYGQQPGKDSGANADNGFSIVGLYSALRDLADFGIETARLSAHHEAVELNVSAAAGPVVLQDLSGELDLKTAKIVDYQLHLADLDTEKSSSVAPQTGILAEDPAKTTDFQAEPAEKHQSAGHTAEAQSEAAPKSSTPVKKSVEEAPAPAASKIGTKQHASSETAADEKVSIAEVLDTLNSGSAFTSAMAISTLTADGFEEILGQLDIATSAVSDFPDLDKDLSAVSGLHPGLKDPLTDAAPDLVISTPDLEPVSGVETPSLPEKPPLAETPNLPETPPLAEVPTVSVVGALIGDYTTRVDNFITSFIHNSNQIEIVHFQTELVIIDMSVLGSSASYTYARSWVTDEGHVISTVGSYQDFADFGMA